MNRESEQSTILGLLEDQILSKKTRLQEVKDRLYYIEHQRDALLVARSYRRDAGEPVEDGEPTLADSEYKALCEEEKQLSAEIKDLEAQAKVADYQGPQPF